MKDIDFTKKATISWDALNIDYEKPLPFRGAACYIQGVPCDRTGLVTVALDLQYDEVFDAMKRLYSGLRRTADFDDDRIRAEINEYMHASEYGFNGDWLITGVFPEYLDVEGRDLPPLGARVKFVTSIDRYPDAHVEMYERGRVVDVTTDAIWIALDLHHEGLDHWRNRLSLPIATDDDRKRAIRLLAPTK